MFFMRERWTKEFRCIQGENAKDFEDQMREILQVASSPKIIYPQGSIFVAYVEYDTLAFDPETISERYHAEGDVHRCMDCPHLQRRADRRYKKHPCKYSTYGMVYESHPCCDKFYEDLEAGLIQIGGDDGGAVSGTTG